MSNRFSFRFTRLFYYIESFICLLRHLSAKGIFVLPLWFLGKKQLIFSTPVPFSLTIHTWLDALIVKEVLFDKEYESGIVALTEQDRTIVDVGAGCGDFSVYCALRFPHATVTACEIDPLYVSLLQKNVQDNGISSVRILSKKMNSLEELIKETGAIDFLKIDCEGCEYELLTAKNKKALLHVKKISMEYHEWGGKKKEDITTLLLDAGFTVGVSPSSATPKTGHIMAYRKGFPQKSIFERSIS